MNLRHKTVRRREQIMLAALDIFLEQGADNARIEDICARAKASVGSIYHHFGGKKNLGDALYLEALYRYLEPLDQKLSEEPTAQAFFKIIVSHHFTWVRNNPKWARFLLPIRRDSRLNGLDVKIAELNGKYLKSASELLKKYAERGEIRKLPRYLYVPMIMGPCQELVRQYLNNQGGGIPDEVADIVADVIWQGLKS